MKALLAVDGMVHIHPENSLEAFALGKWCEGGIDAAKILVHAEYNNNPHTAHTRFYAEQKFNTPVHCSCGIWYEGEFRDCCPQCNQKELLDPPPVDFKTEQRKRAAGVTECTCSMVYNHKFHEKCPRCGYSGGGA